MSVCVCVHVRTLHAMGPWSVSGDDDIHINEVLSGSAKVGCTLWEAPR